MRNNRVVTNRWISADLFGANRELETKWVRDFFYKYHKSTKRSEHQSYIMKLNTYLSAVLRDTWTEMIDSLRANRAAYGNV